ncbi:hypothetical protein CK216_24245 [Mesorhizobium sp. WSM3876]|nr:hypothetical protein CK216_24245 [Mesorhizobium sp. WSM3876]
MTLHLRHSKCQQANEVALHAAWFKGSSDIYCAMTGPDPGRASVRIGRFATFPPQVEMVFNPLVRHIVPAAGIAASIKD